MLLLKIIYINLEFIYICFYCIYIHTLIHLGQGLALSHFLHAF